MRRKLACRLSSLLLCAGLLAACAQDFDDEFADTEKNLEEKAKALDKELSQQMKSELGEDQPETHNE